MSTRMKNYVSSICSERTRWNMKSALSTASHPAILPIGHEGEFKIKKDQMPAQNTGRRSKTRAYQVVGVKPVAFGEEDGGRRSITLRKKNSDNVAKKAPEKPRSPELILFRAGRDEVKWRAAR